MYVYVCICICVCVVFVCCTLCYRLSNPETRNPAYKGQDALAVYDPDAAIVVGQVQKSAAFDATELPGKQQAGVGEARGRRIR